MKITVAKSAGFCYGVRRAVDMAEQAAGERKVYMLGHITHNDHVIRRLEELGAVTVMSPSEVPVGSTVLIRAHGEPDAVYRALEERKCRVLDATCPNVTRIHTLVRKAEENGRVPIVIGDASHPEIIGIIGCTKGGIVAADSEKLEELFQNMPELTGRPLTFVSQTTAIREKWEKCVNFAKKVCTNAEFFDTICGATSKRQTEAVELANHCGGMIVIGDPKSSNTRRLTQLCEGRCPLVVQVERGEDIPRGRFRQVDMLGITAGASTPEWIIKEVYNTMSEEIMEIEQSFAEMLEESFKTLNTGDKVTGTVVAITPTEVQVELG
ncbi:MAG: 4-hydroxy-3-methylbut-2-enyl diphosphate reductase, partial [Oscillospiraceae bacterium]|nr:4-hydroxy-3-methylbut-2-enyl diphosphate reductase [Oscillospiraceae bacterium]